MDIFQILVLVVFVLGYAAITLEHKLSTHKSAIALAMGGLAWVIVAVSGIGEEELQHALEHTGTEIFGIVAFLLAAMALVEILIHYRFFDIIRLKLASLKFDDRKQFLVMCLLTFFLSAVLDNLTITIVMIQIARRFFKGSNLLVAAAGIVILANAGGAWSPIGDVTTIMLWLAEKFTAAEIITQAFLPAAVLGVIAALLLARQITRDTADVVEEKITLGDDEKVIITFAMVSFSLPIIMNAIGLQPYIGLLLGLGVVWAAIEFFKVKTKKQTHLDANIDEVLQKVDISSIKFFIGILLAVSALNAVGVLEQVSHMVLGEHQEFTRVAIGNVVLGLLSAIVDNVPLTALAIDLITLTDPHLWVLLALTVGTGGSALIIGSVAGVVAQGMVKELTFGKYLKIATVPALIAYFAGVAVWTIQYLLFHA